MHAGREGPVTIEQAVLNLPITQPVGSTGKQERPPVTDSHGEGAGRYTNGFLLHRDLP